MYIIYFDFSFFISNFRFPKRGAAVSHDSRFCLNLFLNLKIELEPDGGLIGFRPFVVSEECERGIGDKESEVVESPLGQQVKSDGTDIQVTGKLCFLFLAIFIVPPDPGRRGGFYLGNHPRVKEKV